MDINKELTSMGGFVGLAQINPIAGNLEANTTIIKDYILKAEDLNLDLVVFPQNALLGAPLDDFIDKFPFILKEVEKCLENLAQYTQKTTAIIGYIDTNKEQKFAVLRFGRFDRSLPLKEFYTSKLFNDGVEYYIKPYSEPSRAGFDYKRLIEVKDLATKSKRPVLAVNQVGAIDSDSYAGLSCAYDENGSLIALAKDFEEQLLIVNPFRKIGNIHTKLPTQPPKEFNLDYEWDLERTYKTLVQGIRDYFKKCGLKRAVLGLSGGLDSTICAVLLADALGSENVYGVSMPSKLTSNESKSDALELAQNLGIGFSEVTIKPMVETTNSCLEALFNDVNNKWHCQYKNSYTPDNIQARSRAMYLWAVSNEFESCIPIATSDKSESYMGYATINGDMSGGFAPIADITKTKLFALGYWMNKNRRDKNSIPESILKKRPGAELAIDPNTGKTLCAEDALMPYEFMDEIIWRIENKNQSYKEILDSDFVYEKKYDITKEQKEEWLKKFFNRMSTSIYKWSIFPPSVIVEPYTINKTKYSQPITSGKINYFTD